MTISSVSVPIMMDNIAQEKDEEFNLILSVSLSLAPAITAGNKNRAVGVIIDATSKNLCVN